MSMQSVASPVPVPPNPKALRHIPGDEGWPFIGNTLKLLRDPVGFGHRMVRQYGTVYRNHAFGGPSVTPSARHLPETSSGRNWIRAAVKNPPRA